MSSVITEEEYVTRFVEAERVLESIGQKNHVTGGEYDDENLISAGAGIQWSGNQNINPEEKLVKQLNIDSETEHLSVIDNFEKRKNSSGSIPNYFSMRVEKSKEIGQDKNSIIGGIEQREKAIRREKFRFMIETLTNPENEQGRYDSGIERLMIRNWEMRVTGVLADTLKIAVKKITSSIYAWFLPLVPVLLSVFGLGLVVSFIIAAISSMGRELSVVERDEAYTKNDNYIYNRACDLYTNFLNEISSYDNGSNSITYCGFNSNIYDVVWLYLTLMEQDQYYNAGKSDDEMIIDNKKEEKYMTDAFNTLFYYVKEKVTVTSDSGSESSYLKITVFKYTYSEWYSDNMPNLNQYAIDEYELLSELLSNDEYVWMRGGGSNLDVSAYGSEAAAIYDYCTNLGMTEEGAAAMVGNLYVESSFNPNISQVSSAHIGIVQWGSERKAGLLSFAAANGVAWNDFQLQLDYMAQELNGGYNHVFQKLCSSHDLEYCVDFIAERYEICPGMLGNWAYSSISGAAYQGLADRRKHAQSYYNYFTAIGTGSGKGQEVVNFACQYIGNPYVWGGESLTNGCDCSGFVMLVYRNFGISLPHSSAAQRNYGIEVGYSNALPGDILCFDGHVGIYMGNGLMVNAKSRKDGIVISSVNPGRLITIRRLMY